MLVVEPAEEEVEGDIDFGHCTRNYNRAEVNGRMRKQGAPLLALNLKRSDVLTACVALAIGWAARTGETPDHPAALEAGNPTNAPLGSISEPRWVGGNEGWSHAAPWFRAQG